MSTSEDRGERLEVPPKSAGPLTRAWVSIALSPMFFVAAMAAGEGIISACGCSSAGTYPWWVAVLSDTAAVSLVLVPCIGAIVFGSRARKVGARGSLLPIAH